MKYVLSDAKFIKKYNRFLCDIEINGEVVFCHIPNTGRLSELLFEGNPVKVRYVGHPNRKTDYELLLAQKNNQWYSVDSRMPNALVKEWAAAGLIPQWHGSSLKSEKTYGQSRFDFQISGALNGYIEVKGVTLEKAGVGYFPDAPTERGKKHLQELMNASAEGLYSAVVFVCQSEQIQSFSPNDATDPEFGNLLRQMRENQIEILAIQAVVTDTGISFGKFIPVAL